MADDIQEPEKQEINFVPDPPKSDIDFVPDGQKVGAGKTFLEHAATGVGPGAAFMAAFPAGAKAGTIVGAAIPGLGETGISEALGAGLGGLITGGTAAAAAAWAQHKALQAVAPEFTKKLETEMAAGEKQHPIASIAGDIASMGPSAKLAPFKLAQIPIRAGIGATVGAVNPLIFQQRAPTAKDVVSGALAGTIFGEARFGKGSKPITPEATDASKVSETTAVHGSLRQQPEQSVREVPVKEGGEGVQPQTEKVQDEVALEKSLEKPPEKPAEPQPEPEAKFPLHYSDEKVTDDAGREVAQDPKTAEWKLKPPEEKAVPLTKEQEKVEQERLAQELPQAEHDPADIYGIAERLRDERAKSGQTIKIEPGKGLSDVEAVSLGQEILSKDPAAAQKAYDAFTKSKAVSVKGISTTRAAGEKAFRDARRIELKLGKDSPEWKAAFDEGVKWDKASKEMQTEWHKAGQAQQGQTDLDTGSFTGLQRAFQEKHGKDFSPDQAQHATEVSDSVAAANKDTVDAKEKLFQILHPKLSPGLKAAYKTVREAAVRAANAEKKAMVAKSAKEKKIAEAERREAQKKMDRANREIREAAIKAARQEQKDLADPAGKVWRVAREYIEKGEENFDDIRNKVASDLGLKVSEVDRLMGQDKRVKYLADDLWRKQLVERRLREQAKLWLRTADLPGFKKFINSIPSSMFRIRVGLHGWVAMGTHAPAVLFIPKYWNNYFKNWMRMYKMVGVPLSSKGQDAAIAFYEREMQDLQRRPTFRRAKEAGLQNDPYRYEEYAVQPLISRAVTKLSPKFAEWVNKQTGMGNRGYSVLKVLRQDLFDQEWNKLPKTSQIDQIAEAIAKDINHLTGVTKAMAPKGSNIAFFAPRLMASRAMLLYGDNYKMMETFATWKQASEGDRQFAIQKAKQIGWITGTLASLLAINEGINKALGSKQKVNVTDPFKHDWLRFKIAGMNVAYGSSLVTMIRLPMRLFTGIVNDRKLNKIIYEDENTYKTLGDYARSQLSPVASLGADLAFGRDYSERPLPRAGFGLVEGKTTMPKRLQAEGVQPWAWNRYWLNQALPIPFQEGVKEVWHGMDMPQETQNQWLKVLSTIAFMTGTGARIDEDVQPQPTPDIKLPQIK